MAGLHGFARQGGSILSRGWLATVEASRMGATLASSTGNYIGAS